MNYSGVSLTAALERYNRLFDNQHYHQIAALLTADLHTERDAPQVTDALNWLIDACLGLCGSSAHENAPRLLAVFCGQNDITFSTVDAIYRYLLIFQQSHDTRADDFESTAKALLRAYAAQDALSPAASHANGIHSWQGRMTYELFTAADYLTQAAIQLLQHGSAAYIREKLQHGLRRITGALYEGVRHSRDADAFDFHGTHFPKLGE